MNRSRYGVNKIKANIHMHFNKWNEDENEELYLPTLTSGKNGLNISLRGNFIDPTGKYSVTGQNGSTINLNYVYTSLVIAKVFT